MAAVDVLEDKNKKMLDQNSTTNMILLTKIQVNIKIKHIKELIYNLIRLR